jgi:hypothetical protein
MPTTLLEKSFGSGWHIPVEHDLTISIYDADIHRSGMQVDATVGFIYLGVESHWPSSSLPIAVFVASIPQRYPEEEVSIIIKAALAHCSPPLTRV